MLRVIHSARERDRVVVDRGHRSNPIGKRAVAIVNEVGKGLGRRYKWQGTNARRQSLERGCFFHIWI